MKFYQLVTFKFYCSNSTPPECKDAFHYLCCRGVSDPVKPENQLYYASYPILESIRIPFWWCNLDVDSFLKSLLIFLSSSLLISPQNPLVFSHIIPSLEGGLDRSLAFILFTLNRIWQKWWGGISEIRLQNMCPSLIIHFDKAAMSARPTWQRKEGSLQPPTSKEWGLLVCQPSRKGILPTIVWTSSDVRSSTAKPSDVTVGPAGSCVQPSEILRARGA